MFAVFPYITPFDFEGPVSSGETVQLACLVTKGDPPLSIKWFFNGEPLIPHLGAITGMFGQKTSILSINSVKQINRGRYTCLATNEAGTASYSADLRVNGY
jgi:Immunoglobulin domain